MRLPYERVDYGGAFGGTNDLDYLQLNPGVVPTLIDGETVIWQSNTILRYLANKVGLKRLMRGHCTTSGEPLRGS